MVGSGTRSNCKTQTTTERVIPVLMIYRFRCDGSGSRDLWRDHLAGHDAVAVGEALWLSLRDRPVSCRELKAGVQSGQMMIRQETGRQDSGRAQSVSESAKY